MRIVVLTMNDRFNDKVVVVTGATGGLCSEMVLGFLREGAKVLALGRSEDKLAALTERVSGAGYDVERLLCCSADVLDRAALEAARDQAISRWGRIDVLVNGAGGNVAGATTQQEMVGKDGDLSGTFFEMDMEALDGVVKLNFDGSVLPTQVFAEPMAKAGQGCVLNVSSMATDRAITKVAGYSASKAAIENFTRWLAVHLAPSGVRVNAVSPGFFVTEQNRFLLMGEDGKSPTPRAEKILAGTPFGRFGDAAELIGAVNYLCSDDAGFVTGVTLAVDGGFSAYSGV